MTHLTRDEFKGFTERLYQTTDDGFRGVHDRLDMLNGRTLKGEIAHAELKARLTSVEKEVFRRRADDHTTVPIATPSYFTKREKALVGLGILFVTALVKVLLMAGQFVVELGKAAVQAK